MKTLILLLVSVIYGFYAALPFTSLRERQGYYFIMLLPILGNFLWIWSSKRLEAKEVYQFGIFFDVIISLSFFLVPVFMGAGIELKPSGVVGLLMIFLGIILLKI